MDANAWFTISIVGYSLAAVLLIVTMILFFKMNIMAIIGDLSGKTAARQIQEIREQNTNSGHKRYMPSAFNLERGSLTEPVRSVPSRSSRFGNRSSELRGSQVSNDRTEAMAQVKARKVLVPIPSGETELLATHVGTEVLASSEATEVLGVNAGTEVLPSSEAIEVLFTGSETEVLGVNAGTEVLPSSEATEVLHTGSETEVLGVNAGTEVLPSSEATEVLAQNETEVLVPNASSETEVLEPNGISATEILAPNSRHATELLVPTNETEVLSDDKATTVLDQENCESTEAIPFKIVKDIKIIHSDERIN